MIKKLGYLLKNFLYDMKIGSRLGLGFSIILAVFILAATITMWSLSITISKVNHVERESVPDVLLASEMTIELASYEMNLYKTAVMSSDTGLNKALDEIEKLRKNIQMFKTSSEKKRDTAAINTVRNLEIDYWTLYLYGFAGVEAYLGKGPKIGRERFSSFDEKANQIEKELNRSKTSVLKRSAL